jgi:hypothetical protein
VKDLIEFIAKKLVAHPEDVQVRKIENDEGQTVELRVHDDDMGRVIGKDGRTAKAMRTLVSTAAGKKDTQATLEIIEEDE